MNPEQEIKMRNDIFLQQNVDFCIQSPNDTGKADVAKGW